MPLRPFSHPPRSISGKPEEAEKLENINQTMRQYLSQGILQPHEGMIYIERSVAGKIRKGLLVCRDLKIRLQQRFFQLDSSY